MISWRIRRLAATTSTNDDAKSAAEAGEDEGLVIHALKQTAGRGRHGRKWESPEGNLYCSVLLRPSSLRRDFGFYTFVAALALFDVVQECLPRAEVTLKWPNDILVDGKKIAGILLESGENWLVIGMGLNVLNHPENAMFPSTSLQESGADALDIDVVLERLLDRLSHWDEMIRQQGFAPIRAAWLERAPKARMTVKLPDETLEGDFIDVDEQGHLRLRLPGGEERVIATGDVFLP